MFFGKYVLNNILKMLYYIKIRNTIIFKLIFTLEELYSTKTQLTKSGVLILKNSNIVLLKLKHLRNVLAKMITICLQIVK